jgi:hypothetical protein
VKDSGIQVNIRPVQMEGFVDSHACRYEQTEQGCIGAGTEPLRRGELLGSAEEPCDLLIAIDVRRLASVAMREKADGWNLRTRLAGTVPEGEAPDHTQSPSPGRGLSVYRLGGPAKRQFPGDVEGAFDLEELNKVP